MNIQLERVCISCNNIFTAEIFIVAQIQKPD